MALYHYHFTLLHEKKPKTHFTDDSFNTEIAAEFVTIYSFTITGMTLKIDKQGVDPITLRSSELVAF